MEFSILNLDPRLLATLTDLNFHTMTPIQKLALPLFFDGHDLLAQAPTGSGKTIAFGLGSLSQLDLSSKNVQSLIICPTRELASQVTNEIKKIGRRLENLRVCLLSGGSPLRPQAIALSMGAHVVVGTPGRLLDHISRNTLDLFKVKTLVIDEADRLLDMGFYDDLLQIFESLPNKRQTCLFSATFSDAIRDIAKLLLHNPQTVVADINTESKALIKQVFYQVKNSEKPKTLVSILGSQEIQSALVFCTTKARCDEVALNLSKLGWSAASIHSDLEQFERIEVLLAFTNGSLSILVATDVASRGLDISQLPLVINYDISRDPEVHIHRIGRTGRAGHAGKAITLFTESERYHLEKIESLQSDSLEIQFANEVESSEKNKFLTSKWVTLKIAGGKKNKLRPGDLLGAFVKELEIEAGHLGKINIFDFSSYIAIDRNIYMDRLAELATIRVKGKNFKFQLLQF